MVSIPWTELLSWLYFFSNMGRIVAYLPQIKAAWCCESGARSVSLLTWSYFAFAHLTALLYTTYVLHDSKTTMIFAGNFLITMMLVGVLLWKRWIFYRLAIQRRDHVEAEASGV